MTRSANVALSIFVSFISMAGCATGSDGSGGDPGSSADGTEPQTQGNDSTGSQASGDGGSSADSSSNSNGSSSGAGGGGSCSGYADPNTSANCVDTAYCGGSKPACNPNGCDTTYWCNLSTKKCVKKPSGC